MQVIYDGRCFGCGADNTRGLQMRFEPGNGVSVALFDVPEQYQSWAGVVHGGLVALMLDEAVGWAAWHAGHPGVTGRLAVSFRRPLRLGERVRIVGQVERVRRTLVYCNAVVESVDDGARIADGSATLVMSDAKVELPPR